MARKKKNSNFNPTGVGDYDVGYGRPPEHSKIQEGERRNPKGRPKGSKNKPIALTDFAKLVQAEGQHPILLSKGSKQTVPLNQAVMRMRSKKALEGDVRAARDHFNLQMAAARELRAAQESGFQAVVDYKARMLAELARREEQGLPLPKLYPHPDHILLDFENRTFTIAGPSNPREEALWINFERALQWAEYSLMVSIADLAKEPDGPNRTWLIEEVSYYLGLTIKWRAALGIPWMVDPPDHDPDWELLGSVKKHRH